MPMSSAAEILDWLVATVAKENGCPASALDADKSIHTLGIDSALVISLTFEMEKRFAVTLDPAAMFAQPSLRAFAAMVAEQIAAGTGRS